MSYFDRSGSGRDFPLGYQNEPPSNIEEGNDETTSEAAQSTVDFGRDTDPDSEGPSLSESRSITLSDISRFELADGNTRAYKLVIEFLQTLEGLYDGLQALIDSPEANEIAPPSQQPDWTVAESNQGPDPNAFVPIVTPPETTTFPGKDAQPLTKVEPSQARQPIPLRPTVTQTLRLGIQGIQKLIDDEAWREGEKEPERERDRYRQAEREDRKKKREEAKKERERQRQQKKVDAEKKKRDEEVAALQERGRKKARSEQIRKQRDEEKRQKQEAEAQHKASEQESARIEKEKARLKFENQKQRARQREEAETQQKRKEQEKAEAERVNREKEERDGEEAAVAAAAESKRIKNNENTARRRNREREKKRKAREEAAVAAAASTNNATQEDAQSPNDAQRPSDTLTSVPIFNPQQQEAQATWPVRSADDTTLDDAQRPSNVLVTDSATNAQQQQQPQATLLVRLRHSFNDWWQSLWNPV